MSARRGHTGRLQAGRAAAGDENFFRLGRRRQLECPLRADGGVDGAGQRRPLHRCEAVIAGDAVPDFRFPALPRFYRPFRVGNQPFADTNQVGLALPSISSAICGMMMLPTVMTGIETALFIAAASGTSSPRLFFFGAAVSGAIARGEIPAGLAPWETLRPSTPAFSSLCAICQASSDVRPPGKTSLPLTRQIMGKPCPSFA